MAALTSLTGYPASVWTAVKQTLAYAQTSLSTATNLQAETIAEVCGRTVINALGAFDTYMLGLGMVQAYVTLAPLLTYSLPLTPSQIALITTRIGAFQGLAAQMVVIRPVILNSSVALSQGTPLVSGSTLIEFLMGYSGESFSATGAPDIPTAAAEEAVAWQLINQAMISGGVPSPGDLYGLTQRLYVLANSIASDLSDQTFAVSNDVTWGRMFGLPLMVQAASVYQTDPTSLISQQLSVARLATKQAIDAFTLTQLSAAQGVPSNVQLVQVRVNDTLPKIAARELGDFEQWTSIASLNGLQPPYISADRTVPNTAAPGQKIYLPTGADVELGQQIPSYEVNYLGRDLYLGALNSEMPPWSGDFETISGYANLGISLGRRLQTGIGALLFHQSYGSRIPPEIGNVANIGAASLLSSFAKAAILSDPRVYEVTKLDVNFVSDLGGYSIKASVQPNGSGAGSALVDEVLKPGA